MYVYVSRLFQGQVNKQTDISVLHTYQFTAETTLQIFLSKYRFRAIGQEKPIECDKSDKLMVKFGTQLALNCSR